MGWLHFLTAMSIALAGTAEAPAALEPELAAIQAVTRSDGDALWPGYGAAPFGFLLIEDGRETLLCHPSAPPGFTARGHDPATGCERLERSRGNLPDNLLAAMPIFGPPSTIVMGTPAATGLTPVRWRSTILHEHFHQWQASLPDYYDRVAALDLAGGDETGMWMLNYPFPYSDPAVGAAYGEASRALAEAIAARGTDRFGPQLGRYLALRRAFASAAGERNWRYLEFQLWQEGVARWTELALAQRARDPAARADGAAREQQVLEALRQPDLAGQQRLIAYPLGAGEAMLLEYCGPAWRSLYPALLSLGPLLEQAERSCRAAN